MGVYDTFWWALGYDTPAVTGAAASAGNMSASSSPAAAAGAAAAAQQQQAQPSQALNSSPPPPPPADNTLKPGLAVAIMGGTFVGMSALFWPFIAPVIRRHVLPFIPATDMQVRQKHIILSVCSHLLSPSFFFFLLLLLLKHH